MHPPHRGPTLASPDGPPALRCDPAQAGDRFAVPIGDVYEVSPIFAPGVAALPILSYSGETRSNVIKINGQPNPILADSYLYP